MKFRVFFVLVVVVLIAGLAINQIFKRNNDDIPLSSSEYDDNWPTWRGPLFTGEAVKGNPPTTWSEKKNVKWKH